MTEKLQRLRQLLHDKQLDGVLLTRRDNVAWLTEGASFYVVDRAEVGVASLLVAADAVTLIAPENELPRILAEEPLPFAINTRSYAWYQTPDAALGTWPRIGSDTPRAGATDLQNALIDLRHGLNAAERERFALLGQQVAAVVEDVARGVRVGVTEQAVEAEIYARCLPLAIRPVCTLIAADARIAAWKHPTPGPTPLRQQMLITLGAERHGLNVSVTRMVHVGEPSADDRARLRTVAEIHADIIAASRPGRAWQAIFSDIQASYARHGFPNAWRAHHQGGPAGYGCRDFIVTMATPGRLVAPQALAWNPTLPGVKSEETVVITAEGPQFLTRTDAWPTIALRRGKSLWHFADWLVLTDRKN
ncbi:M24 family metallopeptidase [Erwinia sp. 9145]|uniref:M24 family metallopeptidase n=1 Tax=Erwinia sp. 9145 TaxID=1500895 RepID=UPI000557F96D|nr:M24 family metallopeptidase [Erwinia sp. 9145]